MAADTGEYVTVTRADIAVGWPEGQQNQSLTLQTVSGEAVPMLKDIFLTRTLGWGR
jgi:hypothetical protein